MTVRFPQEIQQKSLTGEVKRPFIKYLELVCKNKNKKAEKGIFSY